MNETQRDHIKRQEVERLERVVERREDKALRPDLVNSDGRTVDTKAADAHKRGRVGDARRKLNAARKR